MGLYGSMFPQVNYSPQYGGSPQQPYGYQQQPQYPVMQPQQAQQSTSLLEALPSILYNFKGLNTGPQENIAGQLQQVATAQMDTNNPLYQQIYGQQKAQATQNLAQGIQEISNQNRKLSSMGRVPLFDPERGGEQLFRGLTQGYQNAGNLAAQGTERTLSNAGSTLNTAYSNANNLALMQNTSQYQQAKGETGIAGILKNLFGL